MPRNSLMGHSTPPLAPWLKDRGVTKKGAPYAERALVLMLEAVEICAQAEGELQAGLARAVFDEAVFRKLELPKRSPEFISSYLAGRK